MHHIGFTGTQSGMTDTQYLITKLFFQKYKIEIEDVHHGDCIGADADFHILVRLYSNIKIIIHPPKNKSKRAFKQGDVILEPDEYLKRNHDIVDACNILLATPKENEEVLRSGTWATIRYGKKSKKMVIIIFPDGKVDITNDRKN